jgi:sugar phosphate isomerase/epimerase
MARRWPLGVCRLAWRADARSTSVRARQLGFDHLDLVGDEDATDLAVPVGIRLARRPRAGYAWPAPKATADWASEVQHLRDCTRPRVEPWAGSLFGSDDAIQRAIEEVPGLRLVVDTGHVAQWGGDVLSLLPYADHVQLRQAARGIGQLPAEQGDVDFAAVFDRLDALGYEGLLSIEYFDLPGLGWPLVDPPSYTAALKDLVCPMLERMGRPEQDEST